MSLFEAPAFDDHEKVLFVNDATVGLRAIIAIHSTRLGPALGGCRMWPYPSEADALNDVLRLSRGMTYKSATLNCRLGGGKSVIIGDARTLKTPQLMQAMGRAIDALGERYIAGEDIGTNPLDMKEMRTSTRCVSCLRREDGGYGDPAPMTALGVFSAMQAGVESALGSDDLNGIRVAVQGVGNVGFSLCRLLAEAGARITVCDVATVNLDRAVAELGVTAVSPDAIYDVQAEVFAPCAMGAIINDETIPRIKARVVCGAANNQLAEDRHGQELSDREITYLPDYVANGGGLIQCAAEWYREDAEAVRGNVMGIRETCADILRRAAEAGVSSNSAADRMAEERFRG